jgi:hypothetical protein
MARGKKRTAEPRPVTPSESEDESGSQNDDDASLSGGFDDSWDVRDSSEGEAFDFEDDEDGDENDETLQYDHPDLAQADRLPYGTFNTVLPEPSRKKRGPKPKDRAQ